MSEESRRSLSAETIAAALTTTHDIVTMQKLEETSANLDNMTGMAQSIRIKRELQSIKGQINFSETEMIKSVQNLQQSVLTSIESVVITTYREGTLNQLSIMEPDD
jgi:predicted nucleic acid-binding protein